MNVEIPELAQVLAGLSGLQARLNAFGQLVTDHRLEQEWYTLRQAARLKRGIEHRQDDKGNARERSSTGRRSRPLMESSARRLPLSRRTVY